jgi:threonine/homoserine/homoserine lactone efflux protein
LWRTWPRRGRAAAAGPAAEVAVTGGPARAFRAGMLTNLLNPKVGV